MATVLAFDSSRVRPGHGARRGRPEPIADITVARSADAGRHKVTFEIQGYDDGTGHLVWTGKAFTREADGRRYDRQIAAELRYCANGWDPPNRIQGGKKGRNRIVRGRR